MDDYWLTKRDDGTITYNTHSSFGTMNTNKEKIKEMLNSKNEPDRDIGLRIVKFLESFGEKFD